MPSARQNGAVGPGHSITYSMGGKKMKHVKTLNKATLKQSAAKGGCGECQTSCQSACKTSCTVANQKCER